MTYPAQPSSSPRVAVIGGGIAGSSVALRLAELGAQVSLLEQGPSLVNGPPACHLHAGGNLYREISEEQCVQLLEQSIDTIKCFPHSLNLRPTVIAIPQHDQGTVLELLPRLQRLQAHYQQLIEQDPDNQRLGPAEHYYRLIEQAELVELAKREPLAQPQCLEEWLIPIAKNLELNQLKFPILVVQEYGLSLLRLAATVQLASEQLATCQTLTNSKVSKIVRCESDDGVWRVEYQHQGQQHSLYADYLVNACGYQSGNVDDMLGLQRQRLVEFKAAYLSRWAEQSAYPWPELIVHGQRGTPQGMAQLTPYPGGLFQLHGMTQEITLFEQGLVRSSEDSAQPELGPLFKRKLTQGWTEQEVAERTDKAIEHMAQYLPQLSQAGLGGKPLFGAQQIPGDDPSLRAVGVSFDDPYYARTEIVKFSSAMQVANDIGEKLHQLGWLGEAALQRPIALESTQSLGYAEILGLAEELALERGYPKELAG